jgi:hypothetical protein
MRIGFMAVGSREEVDCTPVAKVIKSGHNPQTYAPKRLQSKIEAVLLGRSLQQSRYVFERGVRP